MTNIVCPLQAAVEKDPKAIAFIVGKKKISYLTLNSYVNHRIKALTTAGVKPHDRIAIQSINSLNLIVTLLALWRIGAVACLFSTRLPKGELAKGIRRLNARPFPLTRTTCRVLKNKPVQTHDKISLNQEATILFTSGSMGKSKAVVHTYGNHYYSALGANDNIPLRSGDRWLLSLPLYHVGGLGILFRTLLVGATMVLLEKSNELAATLRQSHITHVSLVTTQLYRLLQSDQMLGKSLKAMLIGGGPISSDLIKQARQRKWPIFISYGLTEMASQVASSTPSDFKKDWVVSAKVLKFRDVKINKDKEILVKGKTLFKGYVEGAVLKRHLGKGGWFFTRDLGVLDRKGRLIVLGRKDNLFISGGENIQPEEIEKCLLNCDDIAQVVVVPQKDVEFGFRPVAFVSTTCNQKIDENKIRSQLANLLPKYKIPIAFYRWPAKIKEQAFKMPRQKLKEMI